MTNLADLQAAARLTKLQADACRFACENFQARQSISEEETIEYFEKFDLVCVVWTERTDDQKPFDKSDAKLRLVKGSHLIEGDQQYTLNAFHVADLEEALRWSALFSRSEADQSPGLRLATENGQRI